MALASTANPALALLGDALAMLPWNRTASPWEAGSVLFRRPDGGIWPYDPAGGRKRPLVVRYLRGTPRLGQIGARQHDQYRPVPQHGGHGHERRQAAADRQGRYRASSAEGFVRLMQEALGPQRKHEAIFVSLQFAPGFEFNIFDLQVGCEYPLPLEKAFLQNFLAAGDAAAGHIDAVRGHGAADLAGHRRGLPALHRDWRRGQALSAGRRAARWTRRCAAIGIKLHHESPYWRDVVNALCDAGEYRLAERAQRHAVPILEDLIGAVRIRPGARPVRRSEAEPRPSEKAGADFRALHRRPDPPLPDA